MGKERKIEIDDRMPVNCRGKSSFPKSMKKNEIWPFLLSKAIFKLISQTENID